MFLVHPSRSFDHVTHSFVIFPSKSSFQLEVPSRVVKLILKATDENNDGLISVQEVENLLKRIGAQDRLSKKEIEELMTDIGIDEGAAGVSITKLKELLMPRKIK